jgi:hypothetical protein
MIKFSKATIKDGKIEIIETKEIDVSRIGNCPHSIFVAEHYTDNGCKCYDRSEKVMREWGYKWNEIKGMWI